MGGRGKTPTVAHVVELLLDAGERPAVLSRGYGRRQPDDGVVIVSDGRHLRADLDRSGDEPLMLARHLPGAAVLVCEVRATAAALAETVIGVSVHVLDDGFQHRSIARDIDIVLVTRADLRDRRLPFGRLRSPVTALRDAHAVIVDDVDPADAVALVERWIDAGRTRVFSLRRGLGPPVWIQPPSGGSPPGEGAGPVLAVAGIAAPERFARSLEAGGWQVAELMGFADHHRYDRGDLERIASAAAGRLVITTEKDAVRMLPLRPTPVPVAMVPLVAAIEPEAQFREWLLASLAGART